MVCIDNYYGALLKASMLDIDARNALLSRAASLPYKLANESCNNNVKESEYITLNSAVEKLEKSLESVKALREELKRNLELCRSEKELEIMELEQQIKSLKIDQSEQCKDNSNDKVLKIVSECPHCNEKISIKIEKCED
jgi:predicted RNase H-like nuclease (RuvC/YqgF family)